MLDITEKKSMEAELAEHRHRLEQQVERRTAMLERRISVLESANANLSTKIEENMAVLYQARLARLHCQVLHSLVEEAILDVDAGGLLTLINPAAEQLLMIGSEKALGRPLAEVLSLTGSDGLITVEDIQRRCLARKHESVRVEAAILSRPDGASLAVSGWFAPITNADGQTLGLLVLLHPTTNDVGS
jgi:PAS domain-containing protein